MFYIKSMFSLVYLVMDWIAHIYDSYNIMVLFRFHDMITNLFLSLYMYLVHIIF